MLHFFSHILFIYCSYTLLLTHVDWSKWLLTRERNPAGIRLLILFGSIAMGYTVSCFFLELLAMGQRLPDWIAG